MASGGWRKDAGRKCLNKHGKRTVSMGIKLNATERRLINSTISGENISAPELLLTHPLVVKHAKKLKINLD